MFVSYSFNYYLTRVFDYPQVNIAVLIVHKN